MTTIASVDPKILIALIAAIGSLIVAFVSAMVAILTAIWGHRNQTELEQLKVRLAESKAENDARRDYEYDARKRLYEECEPIFFQLNEAAENWLHRILSLARASRSGHLGLGEGGWLAAEGYYTLSTYYNLLAPLALFILIKHRLTLIDLSVDAVVKARYDLMKWLYLSWTDDFEFARCEPKIEYTPNEENWRDLRKDNPPKYWRQGIPVGRLDGAAESLLIKETGAPPRLLSFGEFEKIYRKGDSETRRMFEVVVDIFDGFHPRTRPVLWRILISQAHICNAIVEAGRIKHESSSSEFKPIREFGEAQRRAYDWRQEGENVSDNEAYQAFAVASDYLADHLPELCNSAHSIRRPNQ